MFKLKKKNKKEVFDYDANSKEERGERWRSKDDARE